MKGDHVVYCARATTSPLQRAQTEFLKGEVKRLKEGKTIEEAYPDEEAGEIE